MLQEEGVLMLYQFSGGWSLPSVDPACLAVHALLRFCNVTYRVVDCNTEAMSPNGVCVCVCVCVCVVQLLASPSRARRGAPLSSPPQRRPCCGLPGYCGIYQEAGVCVCVCVCQPPPAITHTHTHPQSTELSINDFLNDVQRAELAAYMSLVETKLRIAGVSGSLLCPLTNTRTLSLTHSLTQLYEVWVSEEGFATLGHPLYSQSRYSWPLSAVLSRITRERVRALALGPSSLLTPRRQQHPQQSEAQTPVWDAVCDAVGAASGYVAGVLVGGRTGHGAIHAGGSAGEAITEHMLFDHARDAYHALSMKLGSDAFFFGDRCVCVYAPLSPSLPLSLSLSLSLPPSLPSALTVLNPTQG
jgi:hypothetical protein